MSKSIQGVGRCLVLFALVVLMATSSRVIASSIFDDDSGWDDPARETPRPRADPNKPKPVKPKPEPAKPKPEAQPESAPEAPAIPSEPSAPEDPAQKSLSALIPDPKATIKEIDAKIKEMGGMKFDNDKSVHLMHMRAVCFLMLGDLPSAKKSMELVVKSKFTNRSIILNSARIDIATNINAPRAMINLASYLEKNPKDEDAFTLYGSSLAANARRNKKKGLPQDKIDIYIQMLAGMESSHSGQKRWGNDWMDRGTYDELMRNREKALRELDTVWRAYQRAADHENDVKRNTRPVKQGIRYIFLPYQIEAMNRAEDEADEAYGKVKEARTKVAKPRWTYSMVPVSPDPKLDLEAKATAAAKDPVSKTLATQTVK